MLGDDFNDFGKHHYDSSTGWSSDPAAIESEQRRKEWRRMADEDYIERNFVADEFINLPNDESIFESFVITAENYFKKWFKKANNQHVVVKKKKWHINDMPNISRNYKIRKESNDFYLSMISGKGVVTLNEKAFKTLGFINGENTLGEIQNKISRELSVKISNSEIEEILDVFID